MGADIVYAGAPKLVGRMDIVDSILRLRHYHEILPRPIEHATQSKRTMPSVSTQVHPGIINYLFKVIGEHSSPILLVKESPEIPWGLIEERSLS